MRPVTKIATGFVLAFGALRINGFDLLLDPVGWALCASGASALRRTVDDPFSRVGLAAVTMVWTSLVIMATYFVDEDRPLMDSPVGHMMGVAGTVGALITVWLAADAVIRRIRFCGDVSRAGLLDVLRWAVAGLGALGVPAGYGYADPGVVLPIVWFAALVALIVVLYRAARLPCLSEEWEPAAV
ncbi:hypothetical protein [Planomonospora sp. ID82291]|uniref:hypothetical protein n=1 Tax=Planomonospora sp. ID82291 TaxID=2738136 RepID=UPI0018C3C7C9|nr:hypothetical protein [Planomonospora sp. ID82291]MBG0814670.1 hypothetical protein [Planomonospora sp. ID82291]